jgi:pentatricopeptide repeat protein
VAASELSSWGGRARSHGTSGSVGAHLDREARSGAGERVAAPEPNATRRRGPGPRATWQHRSSPQQGGEVWGRGTRGDSGAHLCREVWFEATAYVAARGCTPCSLRAYMRGYPVFKVPTDASCEPNYWTYCILLKHFLKSSLVSVQYVDTSGLWNVVELHTVWQLLEMMVKHGLNPTKMTYSSIIAGFCKAMRLREACELLDHMCGKGISPNEEIYTMLIKCCCDTKFFKKALSFVSNMVECGFQPKLESYQYLMVGLCNEEDFDKAESLFNDLLGMDYNHDEVAWKVLNDGLLKAGHVDICSQLLSTMENRHYRINPEIYAMVTKNMQEAAGSVIRELRQAT